MTDGVGSETYTYDVAGRVTHLAKVIDSVTYGIDYAYDLAGNPLTIGYPASGHVVSSGYDAIGRLCGVGASVSNCTVTTPFAQTFTYNAVDQVTGFAYGNTQVTAAFAYSPKRSQLTSIAYTNSTTTLLGLNYFYTYDSTNCPTGTAGNNGQIQCIVDSSPNGGSGRSAVYAYDPLGRISNASTTGSAQYPAWALNWGYDRYGNRLSQNKTVGNPPTDVLTFASPGGAQTNHPDGFSFDASGNMLNDGVNTLTYDAENHVTAAAVGSTAVGEYAYDGNGLRVKKCVPSCSSPTTTTRYIFSGSSVIAEYENGAAVNSPTREYLYAGALKIATVDTATTYHLRDHLSVRVNTNSSGNLIGEQGHYPFGDAWYLNNTTTKEQFTTYERDPETGTGGGDGNDYAMARYHVNRLGRFSSVDPLSGIINDPQSFNHYAYSSNDPINNSDPTGMDDAEEVPGPSSRCLLDAYFGVYACGDMCEARVSSSCNESGGGGGFYLSININFAFPGGGGPFGESSGIPYGATSPAFSLFGLLFGNQSNCDFGGCGNSFGLGSSGFYTPSWLSGIFTPLCTGLFSAIGAVAGGDIGMAGGALATVEGGPLIIVGGVVGGVTGTVAGGVAGYKAGKAICGGINGISYSKNRGGGSGQTQNREFAEAVRRIENALGRPLSPDEIRRLHDEISRAGYTLDEIVQIGIGLLSH